MPRLTVLLALLLLSALHGGAGWHPATDRARLTLWAWERPEQLTFLGSRDVRVAFLAASIYLDDEPLLRPRLQPLRVNPETPLTAVIRLELTPKTPHVFTDTYRAMVTQQILDAIDLPRVRAVQIDFDATKSQRGFYRALLQDLRSKLSPGTALSITALGSWCLGDDWISGLPIDEAVPMMFRMGIDRGNIVRALDGGDDFREPLCRTSVGISTDEPWPQPLLGRRIYIFNPHPWTSTTFDAVERRLEP